MLFPVQCRVSSVGLMEFVPGTCTNIGQSMRNPLVLLPWLLRGSKHERLSRRRQSCCTGVNIFTPLPRLVALR